MAASKRKANTDMIVVKVANQCFSTAVKVLRESGFSYRDVEKKLGIKLNRGFAAFNADRNSEKTARSTVKRKPKS